MNIMNKFKQFVMILAIITISGCYTAKLKIPQKYDIYVSDVKEEDIFDYIKYMVKQSFYKTHKVLIISKNYAEISYSSDLGPEMVYMKTQQFFGSAYNVQLHSNVITVGLPCYEDN